MFTCKRDVVARDRDETETFEKYVSRPSRDRDVETETTTLPRGNTQHLICSNSATDSLHTTAGTYDEVEKV